MILPDVNVLVYAFRAESPDHPRYARWLHDAVDGAAELALLDVVLSGFARIVTNRRIYADPAPTSVALEFIARVIAGRRARWLPPSNLVWTRFADLAAVDPGVKGNLVPDAYIAAMALTHNATVATRDRGFARFDGLRTTDPAESHPAR